MAKARGLGRGIDSLFLENSNEENSVRTIKITEIEPNRDQPRKNFDDDALLTLAESIREHGVIQPLLVRPLIGGGYQIIAGERRWRASRMVGLSEVPVVVRELDDKETMQIALIENLQREDLNAIEESLGYRRLMDEFDMTQDEVSKTVGKSRSAVANSLRLLSLPKKVSKLVEDGEISAGHARALLSLDDEKAMCELAERIVKNQLSVREVEKAVKPKTTTRKLTPPELGIDENTKLAMELENALNEQLSRRVKIKGNGKKGVLEIEYFSHDDLLALAEKLAK